jgi:hypothetical protein
LRDEIVQIMIGFQNHIPASAAVAAAWAALRPVFLALKCDASLPSMPCARVNLYLVYEHLNEKGEARASP